MTGDRQTRLAIAPQIPKQVSIKPDAYGIHVVALPPQVRAVGPWMRPIDVNLGICARRFALRLKGVISSRITPNRSPAGSTPTDDKLYGRTLRIRKLGDNLFIILTHQLQATLLSRRSPNCTRFESDHCCEQRLAMP